MRKVSGNQIFEGLGSISRRTFIASAVASMAMPSAARAGGSRVVVLGGGPAGLAAAFALAQLGVEVTVLEASVLLGGPAPGTFGLFEGADRARALLAAPEPRQRSEAWRLASGAVLDPVSSGGRRAMRTAALTLAESLNHTNPRAALRAGRKRLSDLDPADVSERLGETTLADWRTSDPVVTPWRPMDDAYARARLASPPWATSAAASLIAERALSGRVAWMAPDTWEAVGERLEALGVTIRRGAPAWELEYSAARVIGVQIGLALEGVRLDEVAPEWTSAERPDNPPIFVRELDEHVQALSGCCPVDGLPIAMAADHFVCEGGHRYDLQGEAEDEVEGEVEGASERPAMRPLFADRGGDGIHVEGELPEELVRANIVILATPRPDAARLLGEIVAPAPAVRGTVVTLRVDRPIAGPLVSLLEGCAPFCRAFLSTDAETGHAVVELQAFGPDVPVHEAELRLAVDTSITRLDPEAVIVEVLSIRTTDALPPHLGPIPPADPGIPGLFLAGGFLSDADGAAGLERAVRSGERAAALAAAALGLLTG